MTSSLDRGQLLEQLIDSTVVPPPRSTGQPTPTITTWTTWPDAPAREDLETSLRRRTSVRMFARRPLERAELTTLLVAAWTQDRLSFDEEIAAGNGLSLMCASWRVRGLDPWLYRAHPDGEGLTPVAALPSAPGADSLFLQREFAWAPLVVIVLGDLECAVRRHGGYGHRQLLLRAGAAMQAAALAGLGLGLDGCLFAGLLPSSTFTLAGIDGHVRAPLFGLSVGRPWATQPQATDERG